MLVLDFPFPPQTSLGLCMGWALLSHPQAPLAAKRANAGVELLSCLQLSSGWVPALPQLAGNL